MYLPVFGIAAFCVLGVFLMFDIKRDGSLSRGECIAVLSLWYGALGPSFLWLMAQTHGYTIQ